MRNDEYWGRRAAQRMFEHMQSAEETADQIAQLYFRSSRYLSSQMEGIFERYKTKHSLPEAEARRLLNAQRSKTDIEELLRQLKSGSSDKSKKELIQLIEAPAYRARIERLQQLQALIGQVMQRVYQQEKAISTAHYIDLANKAYCRSMFDIQQRAGVGFSFAQVDRKQIDQVVRSKWSGRNYSSRIWNNTKVLAQDLKEELLINLVTGRTEHEVAQALADKFARGASVARRLVRTESCFISNQMEMKSYEAAGIKRYRYLATLDLRTSKICASLDGKLFLVSEQQPGKNCPPMHPWCRSTTVAEITGDDMACMERIARDPVTGKTYMVPASMTYSEWYEKYVANAVEPDTIKEKDTVIHKSVGAKTRSYKVEDKTTGAEYEFAPGTRIQNSEVFAGSGTRHPLHEGVAEGLTKEYGGTPSKWQHVKGNGILLDPVTGEECPAEVHWFQEKTVGKVKFKVKRWLDEG